MKILLVNGSPRRQGLVAQMLQLIAEEAQALGHEVQWLQVADTQVRPCTGCMACRKTDECVLPADDGHRFAGLVRECDALVVGTPTYWGNMTAPLKLLFDRTVPVFLEENPRGFPLARQKGKRAIIVSTCTTPWPLNVWVKQSRGAIRAVAEVLRSGGMKVVGTLEKGGTWKCRELKPAEQARARRLARKL